MDQLVVYTRCRRRARPRGIKIDDAEIEEQDEAAAGRSFRRRSFDKALKDRGMTLDSLRKDARVDLSVTS